MWIKKEALLIHTWSEKLPLFQVYCDSATFHLITIAVQVLVLWLLYFMECLYTCSPRQSNAVAADARTSIRWGYDIQRYHFAMFPITTYCQLKRHMQIFPARRGGE